MKINPRAAILKLFQTKKSSKRHSKIAQSFKTTGFKNHQTV